MNDKPKNAQCNLFDNPEWWEEHWQGMPEFIQEDQTPFKSICVHFAHRSDMEAFAELVGQNITKFTKYIWYPKLKINKIADRAYVDES